MVVIVWWTVNPLNRIFREHILNVNLEKIIFIIIHPSNPHDTFKQNFASLQNEVENCGSNSRFYIFCFYICSPAKIIIRTWFRDIFTRLTAMAVRLLINNRNSCCEFNSCLNTISIHLGKN